MTIEKNYDFIDSIRCIAIIAIVAEHSITAGGISVHYYNNLYWTFTILSQLTKFATISFFLLAGFLLSDNFLNYTPWQYFKRRLSKIFFPWLFWSLTYLLIDVILLLFKRPIGHNHYLNWNQIKGDIQGLYLLSSYWFIINYMISIGILLVFRRFLYSIYFGVILACFTLFYAINIYHGWIWTNHTTAILGFIFFLWVGAQLRRYWTLIEIWIEKVPSFLILFLIVITFYAAVYEAFKLDDSDVNPTNTLRITNIFYSFACFAILLKIKDFKFIRYLRPRQTTYGIYLIHFIIITFLIPNLFSSFDIRVYGLNQAQFIGYRFTYFLLSYLITFFIVVLINKSSQKALIGR